MRDCYLDDNCELARHFGMSAWNRYQTWFKSLSYVLTLLKQLDNMIFIYLVASKVTISTVKPCRVSK